MQLLITGATGKVGQAFLPRFLADPRLADASVVCICNNRMVEETPRVRAVRGSIGDPAVVASAMHGTTHVLHMATVKEDPVHAMDVSVKGMFLLLEAARRAPDFHQFMLIGGDCVVGHCIVQHEAPVTETTPFRPYPGVYALSKVLEETMLVQYGAQYGLDWTTLRAPWIMEKDDFRYVLSFGPDQFGGPDWDGMIEPAERGAHHAAGRAPLILAADGLPLKRNFVHVDDLVDAMLLALGNPAASRALFNIAMTEPVDYGVVADHLKATRGMGPARIASALHSNLLDNARARLQLGWTPKVDTIGLVERAFTYARTAAEPRKVWYVG
ncbi:MAG: NAD(P)-dependent oxidoreductase [Devosia sp.]